MKKTFLLLLIAILATHGVFAQKITDEFGGKIYRGNIALIVQEDSYLNGKKQSVQVDYNTITYLWVAKILMDEGFQIVNRDEEALKNVKQLLTEYKQEDYIDGLSVQAKGQGADWLLLIDMSHRIVDNRHVTIDYSYRLIGVERNIGDHAKTRWEFTWKSEDDARVEIQKSIGENRIFFTNFIRKFFPVQFGIESTKGKKLELIAYQPVGALTVEDKLYIYKYHNETFNVQGKPCEFNVLKLLATANDFGLKDGYLTAKSDKVISDTNETFACLTKKNTLALERRFFVTVIGIPYNDNENNGYQKKMVNQAVYCGLGELAHIGLIESDLMPFLKKERDLQKTEDYMDGYTVQQLKAVGAQYLIHISNFHYEGEIVSFTLSVLNIESNTVEKIFDCKCHISNLDETVKYYLNRIWVFSCAIEKIDSKTVELYSVIPIDANLNDSYVLMYVKPMSNPMSGETTYQRVELASLKYSEYQGMKHVFTIDKILNKDEMSKISDHLDTYNFLLTPSDNKPDMMKDNSQKNKQLKKEKVNNFLNRLSDAITVQ